MFFSLTLPGTLAGCSSLRVCTPHCESPKPLFFRFTLHVAPSVPSSLHYQPLPQQCPLSSISSISFLQMYLFTLFSCTPFLASSYLSFSLHGFFSISCPSSTAFSLKCLSKRTMIWNPVSSHFWAKTEQSMAASCMAPAPNSCHSFPIQ